jgi:uncharacterized Zn-binding protein involved in type VI secretion
MPAVQRQGDPNSGGGVITSGDRSVLVNGRPIATVGLLVSPHPPCPKGATHCAAKTSIGFGKSVRVNNKPVSITSDKDTCGHLRSGGSPNVKVGN